jgi:hypothetical protein
MISAATTAITRHPVNLSAATSAVPTDMFPGIGRPDIFGWVLSGRTPRSEMFFVGQILVSQPNRRTSGWRSRLNSSRSRPGCWAMAGFGPGDAGHVGAADQTASGQRSAASW